MDAPAASPDAASGADAAVADAPPADRPPGGPARLVLVAGGGAGSDGAQATQARLMGPFGTAVDPSTGEIYIAEADANRVRRIDAAGTIGTALGAGAAAAAAKMPLMTPHDLVFRPGTRQLFVADTFASRVLRLDAATGEIVVVAGTGGQVLTTGLGRSFCVAFDPRGERLYIADTDHDRVPAVDMKTMAVTMTAVAKPRAVAVDSKGILYVVQAGMHVVRAIDAAGKATLVAGTEGKAGGAGDGGPALSATLNAPKHLWVDADDNLLIADTESHLVRKYLPASKTIVRVAGTGAMGAGAPGGAPETIALDRPHGVSVDSRGTIYIADSLNDRVLKIAP
jgi:DNA-binding beta-propeller fold protein YncE